MIYELREYYCRAGGLPILLKRFEDTTLRVWERHGMRPAGFFTTVVGGSNNKLTYFLAWESMEERERVWPQFIQDPEWVAAVKAHQKEYGQVVDKVDNSFLAPTSFSTVK